MKFLLLPVFLTAFFFNAISQLHPYYSGISGSATNYVLKQQLANLITSTHTTFLSYSPDIWDLLEVSDLDPNDPSKVLLLYGYNDADGNTMNDRTRLVGLSQSGSSSVGVWNREHSYPKSLGTPDLGTSGPGADGHHLRAADGEMNGLRGSLIYDYGSGNAGISGSGFYPGDEWKGDVARMMMYMYLRYPTQCVADNVGDPLTTISDFDEMPDIFILWHEQDTVSAFELQRNEEIYQAQGNRNPFIDEPEFATRIWRMAVSLDELDENYDQIKLYPNPTNGEFEIDLPADLEWNYSITNQWGEVVDTGTQDDELTVENEEPGTYFLNLITVNSVYHYKLIKL